MSRRAADAVIAEQRVQVNGVLAKLGQEVHPDDKVILDGRAITPDVKRVTIMLNKPAGYVCSREGQGSKTIYKLLPQELHHLKPVGRLDKESSGLLLLTNDGQLAQQLAHPSYQKTKVYEVVLDKPLALEDKTRIEHGVMLEDGISKLKLENGNLKLEGKNSDFSFQTSSFYHVAMTEGRNRQIRRTFAALGYKVTKLHRTQFGDYSLNNLQVGEYQVINESDD